MIHLRVARPIHYRIFPRRAICIRCWRRIEVFPVRGARGRLHLRCWLLTWGGRGRWRIGRRR